MNPLEQGCQGKDVKSISCFYSLLPCKDWGYEQTNFQKCNNTHYWKRVFQLSKLYEQCLIFERDILQDITMSVSLGPHMYILFIQTINFLSLVIYHPRLRSRNTWCEVIQTLLTAAAALGPLLTFVFPGPGQWSPEYTWGGSRVTHWQSPYFPVSTTEKWYVLIAIIYQKR